MSEIETEVKFYVQDLRRIETRLLIERARLIQARVHETNLRFDTEQGELKRSQRVLRLRQDEQARLTFKGPSIEGERGVASRAEIEFTVEDFGKAQRFLEALGYRVTAFYEKFRATYEWRGLHVMLDELPYGTFVEIEGEDVEEIQRAANLLGLRWEAMVKMGYRALYERAAPRYGLEETNLSFEEVQKTQINLAEFGIRAADE
ncbi:MAG: hypothetical protein Fur002_16470 [Anaerolineales bacterium]